MQTLLQQALAVAITQLGVLEEPPGSNKGRMVNTYLKSVGLGPGFSWCAAFIFWCYQQAATAMGIPNPLIKTAGVTDHWQRAPAKAKITAAQARANPGLVTPGCIGILLLDPHTGAGHTFLVQRLEGTLLHTVEGNSNNGGGREGIGVMNLSRRKLTDKILVGFIDYSRA